MEENEEKRDESINDNDKNINECQLHMQNYAKSMREHMIIEANKKTKEMTK